MQTDVLSLAVEDPGSSDEPVVSVLGTVSVVLEPPLYVLDVDEPGSPEDAVLSVVLLSPQPYGLVQT